METTLRVLAKDQQESASNLFPKHHWENKSINFEPFDRAQASALEAALDNGFDKNHPAIRYFENLFSIQVPKWRSSFLVFKNNKYVIIKTQDIAFFFIKNDSPTIMLFNKMEYPISHSLEDIHKLVSPENFFRINRQYLISFSAIKEVEHYFSRKLIIKLVFAIQEKLLVGKDKATPFLKWLETR